MAIPIFICVAFIVLAGLYVYKRNFVEVKARYRWYLAGPMSAVSNADATEWRDEASKHLSVINPVEVEKEYGEMMTGDPCGLKEMFKDLRKEGNLKQLCNDMQPVLALDEDSVDEAYGLLVRVPNEPKFMWGTVREVTLAYIAEKPVVIWCEASGLLINNTMVAMATAVRASFDSAIKACRKIQIGQKIPLTLDEEQGILSGKESSP